MSPKSPSASLEFCWGSLIFHWDHGNRDPTTPPPSQPALFFFFFLPSPPPFTSTPLPLQNQGLSRWFVPWSYVWMIVMYFKGSSLWFAPFLFQFFQFHFIFLISMLSLHPNTNQAKLPKRRLRLCAVLRLHNNRRHSNDPNAKAVSQCF